MLARSSALPVVKTALRPPATHDRAAVASSIEAMATAFGFEAEAVATPYADFEHTIRHAAPALLCLEATGPGRWLVLVGGGRRQVRALGPDGRRYRLRAADLREMRCANLEAPVAAEVDRLLAAADLPTAPRARAALLRARLGAQQIDGLWLLRLPPSAPFRAQIRQACLLPALGQMFAAHALQYGLWLLAWWTVGATALNGRLDGGWLLTWALLLATLLPFRLAVTWLQGYLTVHTGVLLKRRLLVGALRQRLDDVRRQGIGQFLGRVLESNAIEALAMSGGVQATTAVVELAMAAVVLAFGVGGALHTTALVAWLGIAAILGARLYRRQSAWTVARLDMTHRLVERMVGHRTRLVQEPPQRRHADEDSELATSHHAGHAMDSASAWFLAVVPRGWLVVGITALTPAFLHDPGTSGLAIALGGTLLAYQAFHRLAQGVTQLTEAALAARQVSDLFAAGTEPTPPTAPLLQPTSPPSPGEPVLEAHGLSFRYTPRTAAVLHDVDLTLQAGDRLLLEGPSGAGKSTLTALLSGLRDPDQGMLLLRGLDRATLGTAGWRRRVATAPQFHQNHIFTGTLAWNLLMGRCWPPTATDLEEAERLCRALGLGDLLNRMPAGLLQMVGETGWQLSHGERSRIFLARALLQGADLVLLDESFGALDPQNRAQTLRVAIDEAPALLVIAHP